MYQRLAAITLSLFAFNAHATDRALLIGIGEYQINYANLPGIDLDLNLMQKTAATLGYTDITVLKNQQATLSRVEAAFNELANSVSKDDRVLIYYSGHGTFVADRNGDEADHHDEALTTHDMQITKHGLANVLVDDHFHDLLVKIPSEHILVMIDACHSGTATRAFGDKYQAKTFRWAGMGTVSATRTLSRIGKPDPSQNRIITFSAARDDEESLASSEGSLFTVGLSHAIAEASAQHSHPSPAALQEAGHPVLDANPAQSPPVPSPAQRQPRTIATTVKHRQSAAHTCRPTRHGDDQPHHQPKRRRPPQRLTGQHPTLGRRPQPSPLSRWRQTQHQR